MGGGGGGTNSGPVNGVAGGGVIFLNAKALYLNSNLQLFADGTPGSTPSNLQTHAGAGGGAAGAILLIAQQQPSGSSYSLIASASGGAGSSLSTSTTYPATKSAGGGGSGGFFIFKKCTSGGITQIATPTVNATGGLGGQAYPSTLQGYAGGAGINVTIPDSDYTNPNSPCYAP